MENLKQKILDIAHKPQLASLGTVTDMGNPWVRYVVTVGDGNLEFRCATFLKSRKVAQIEKCPEVHLTCGVNSFNEMVPYIQVQGKAEVLTDEDEKNNFWNEMLEPIFDGPNDPNYVVLVIKPYRIEYCTPGSYEPEVWVRE